MTYLAANTPVAIRGKRGLTIADGVVIEHTDDSDEHIGNAEQWIAVKVVYSETPHLRVGDTVKFRRGIHDVGRTWAGRGKATKKLGHVSIEATP